jgi:hypothetical protein
LLNDSNSDTCKKSLISEVRPHFISTQDSRSTAAQYSLLNIQLRTW